MRYNLIVLLICVTTFIFPNVGCTSEGIDDPDYGDTLKILTYNVRNCKGLDNVTDYNRVGGIISRIDADFVALQELDSATERSNKIVVLNELAAQTAMFPTYRGSISYQGGKYGIGILTKVKPIKTEAVPLPGEEEKRSLLILEMEKYVICCTHFSLTRADRIASTDIIANAVKKYSKPVFLAGDLNTEIGSTEMKNLLKDWLIINNPSQPTIPANVPKKCIDFVLVKKNPNYKVKIVQSVVGNEPVASDHLPVWVKVVVNK
ncbi:MAG: endonuclease/exonuclease/phosphatase family protein [Prolixibacteraceae bacterium]|jgi:endonuclease/exonuclease/phosphatase family metal-dependent hydrolase